jgi:hypothetical protein
VLNTNTEHGMETAPPGRGISGVGRVAIGQEGDMADLFPDRGDTAIIETDRQCQRKWISLQLRRGQKFLLQQKPTNGISYIICVNLHVE